MVGPLDLRVNVFNNDWAAFKWSSDPSLAYGLTIAVGVLLFGLALARVIYVLYKARSNRFSHSSWRWEVWWGLFPLFGILMLAVPGCQWFFIVQEEIRALHDLNYEVLSNELEIHSAEVSAAKERLNAEELYDEAHQRIVNVGEIEQEITQRYKYLDEKLAEADSRFAAAAKMESKNASDNQLINEIHYLLTRREQNISAYATQLEQERTWGALLWIWNELFGWWGAGEDMPGSLNFTINWPPRSKEIKGIKLVVLPEGNEYITFKMNKEGSVPNESGESSESNNTDEKK